MLKTVCTTNDEKKNSNLVIMLKSGLNYLKKKRKMGEDEKEIEKPNIIEDIIENILEFHKQKQEEQELKVLISNQMLSR